MLVIFLFLCLLLPTDVVLKHGATRGSGGVINAIAYIKKTIYKCNVHIKSFRWYNGWKPFVVNRVVNVCQLFEKQANVFDKVAKKLFLLHSNINHACPYNGAVKINGISPNLSFIPSILEAGRYRLQLEFNETSSRPEWIGTLAVDVNINHPFRPSLI
ncbi:uncharacterized protein LOC119657835 isoform X2 [Hermetia illucens]|uniref:uncharacterized protein LOC119657835 isoform X2 n=1 Tax=Hermetia illucens TaxID=343691 RepID=UPI0018CC285D|nr:uncharacterized protein LOC119657835 isoform X2 [Hermetia illucens]